jgi:hypothetical protein
LNLKAVVVTVDGQSAIHDEDEITFEDDDEDAAAETLGRRVAQNLLDRGAQKLLDAIRFEKEEHIEKGEDVVGNDDATAVELPPLPIFKANTTTPTTKELPEVNGTQVV